MSDILEDLQVFDKSRLHLQQAPWYLWPSEPREIRRRLRSTICTPSKMDQAFTHLQSNEKTFDTFSIKKGLMEIKKLLTSFDMFT